MAGVMDMVARGMAGIMGMDRGMVMVGMAVDGGVMVVDGAVTVDGNTYCTHCSPVQE